jgi:hypothetical protein
MEDVCVLSKMLRETYYRIKEIKLKVKLVSVWIWGGLGWGVSRTAQLLY